MTKKNFNLFIKSNKHILPTIIMPVLSILFLALTPVFEEPFSKIMSVATYLTWHNLFELSAIIAGMAIFLISFYTYDQTRSLRAILLGNMMLAAGILDAFHMLSYKGMPAFFIENAAANRATTFWITARLISGAGFLTVSLLSNDRKCSVKKGYFTAAAFLTAILVFIIATWFPSYLPVMYIEGTGLTTVKKLLEYFIMLMLIIASAGYLYKSVKNRDKMYLVMFCALLVSVLSEFTFTIYIDVYGIYNYAGHILKVVSMFVIFRAIFSKHIKTPYIALSNAQKTLRDYADNLDRIVEQRTRQLKIINKRLMEDLEYAREIQKSMLPVYLPDTPDIGFSSVYLSAERLSGDFYDVFKLDESNIGFYLCDVSGHGVPAAMLTVFLKQCVDSIVEADRHKGTISSPSCVLQKVYDAFNQSNFKDDVYIVLIYLIYNIREKELIYSSAGLNETPVLIHADGQVNEINISGFPICRLKEVYKAAYKEFKIPVERGDRLYLYTDGLVEARNKQNALYSPDRLKQFLKGHGNKPLSELTAMVSKELHDFSAGEKLNDDVTMLAVEIR